MLILEEEKLISYFQKAHPFLDDPREALPSKEVMDYFDFCIQANEIVGVEFVNVDAVGFFGIPEFIDGFSNKASVMKKALSPWNFPEYVSATRDIKIPFRMRTHWFKKDLDRLYAISESTDPDYMMRQALIVAEDILERSQPSLAIVCGPISSGRLSVVENLTIFARTVFKVGQKIPVFNQLPFEPVFHKVHGLIEHDSTLCPNGSSSKYFIEHFYEPLFRLPEIQWLPQFIYGYKKSTGAMIEHAIFTELGSKIHYLPPSFSKNLF